MMSALLSAFGKLALSDLRSVQGGPAMHMTRSETFQITELVDIFRAGLLALVPVMDRGRIAWKGEGVYDPWESLAEALYNSIVRSCVENIVSNERDPTIHYALARYGFVPEQYGKHSFLCEKYLRKSGTLTALIELSSVAAPFDVAVLQKLDNDFKPVGRPIGRVLSEAAFELVFPGEHLVAFSDVVTYVP